LYFINYDSALWLGLHEGLHDVGHFGNATGRGVFTDAGQSVSNNSTMLVTQAFSQVVKFLA